MGNIKQIILPCIAALCIGLLGGIYIGRNGLSPSVQLSRYDEISAELPTQTAPHHSEDMGKININIASAKELTMIPGIGPSTAEKIVAYRLRYGPFLKLDELTKVDGIGEAGLRKMKDYITVGG